MATPARSVQVHVQQDEVAIGQAVTELLVRHAEDAVRERGRFVLALSGGSLPGIVFPQLRAAAERAAKEHRMLVDFSRWWVVFADERCVPLDHKESNFRLCNEKLFQWAPIPARQILPVNPELVRNPGQAARDYELRLQRLFGASRQQLENLEFDDSRVRLDLVFLGLGPDGHTCSLFPGDQRTLQSEALVAAVHNSPKQPKQRITLTLPVLANARAAVFVAAGAGKAEAIRHILLPGPPARAGNSASESSGRGRRGRSEAKEAVQGDSGSEQEEDSEAEMSDEGEAADEELLPAAMVSSTQIHWFLDRGASAGLLRPRL